jgi:hypothetical protein
MFHSLFGIFQVVFFSFCLFSWPKPFVLAQPGVGYSHPDAEESRAPLKVKLSGFINTKPEGDSTVIKLGIGIYRETYQFELVKMEAVDRERTTSQKVLDPTESRDIAYDLTGPKDLLSKIAQSEPGTPLAITGFIQQRERKMQVTAVEIIGLGN